MKKHAILIPFLCCLLLGGCGEKAPVAPDSYAEGFYNYVKNQF